MEQIIKNIKDADSYRKLAGYYDELIGKHYYNNLYNVFKKFTKHFPAQTRHLDIGCGTGYLIKKSRDLKFSPEGIDISKEMIEIAKNNNPGINIYHGNFMNITKYYSIITASNDVLNHLSTDYGFNNILHHIYNILLPNGIFLSDAVSAHDILHNWENCTHLYTDESAFRCHVTHKIINIKQPTGLMKRNWEFYINGRWEQDEVETEMVCGITPDEIKINSKNIGFEVHLFDWDSGGSCKPDTIRIGIFLTRKEKD